MCTLTKGSRTPGGKDVAMLATTQRDSQANAKEGVVATPLLRIGPRILVENVASRRVTEDE